MTGICHLVTNHGNGWFSICHVWLPNDATLKGWTSVTEEAIETGLVRCGVPPIKFGTSRCPQTSLEHLRAPSAVRGDTSTAAGGGGRHALKACARLGCWPNGRWVLGPSAGPWSLRQSVACCFPYCGGLALAEVADAFLLHLFWLSLGVSCSSPLHQEASPILLSEDSLLFIEAGGAWLARSPVGFGTQWTWTNALIICSPSWKPVQPMFPVGNVHMAWNISCSLSWRWNQSNHFSSWSGSPESKTQIQQQIHMVFTYLKGRYYTSHLTSPYFHNLDLILWTKINLSTQISPNG